MPVGSALRRKIADAVEEELQIAMAEHAGDEFDCLEDHDCIDPIGHLFKTQCGVTRCVYCCKIAWG